MALLTDGERGNGQHLSLELDLQGLETYVNQTTEGWLRYRLTLRNGKEILTRIDGTLHDNDVRVLEDMFSNPKKETFEPLEPDFQLAIEPIEEDEYAVTCMINHGATIDKTYGTSAVGLRLVTTLDATKKFADELQASRISFTQDLEFRDYEPKSLPEK